MAYNESKSIAIVLNTYFVPRNVLYHCKINNVRVPVLTSPQGIPSYAAGNWYRSPGAHCCKRTRNVRRENNERKNGRRMNKS